MSHPFSRRAFVAAPAALLLAACTVPAATGAKPVRAPFDCAFRAVETAGMVDITASVDPTRAFAGRYRLSLGRSGAGNAAMIDQGGEFIARAGERIDLGRISLSGPATLVGTLTVDWDGGSVDCPLTRI